MAPRNKDARVRSRVTGSHDNEVRYFADQNGISLDQARALIAAMPSTGRPRAAKPRL